MESQPRRSFGYYLGLVFKGMGYGITHIVPGIGGGIVLVVMGIYEDFVEAVGNFFVRRDRWRIYIPFILCLGLGMVIAMLALSRVITGVTDAYPVATAFFFMGLLVGTIPRVFTLHDDMRFTPKRGLALVIGLAIVVGFRILQDRVGVRDAGSLTGVGGLSYNALTSFVAGGASVTPGLDGTYIWLLAGSYDVIIGAIKQITELNFQWGLLISAGVGAVAGILVFSKVIDSFFKKSPSIAYYAVLGMLTGSVYGLWPTEQRSANLFVVIACFVVGTAIAYFMGRKENQLDID